MPKICIKHGIYHTTKCTQCVEQRNKIYDTTKRNQAHKKVYNNKKWRDARQRALTRDMFLCVICNDPATVVDHIKELSDGGAEYDLINLQSLCDTCHARKTAEEKGNREGGLNL